MATLDSLQDLLDDGLIAVVSGEKGTKDPSYIEKKDDAYSGIIAGQRVHGYDLDELLDKLRARRGSQASDLAWSASWKTIDHKEAMTWIKRTLKEYIAAAGVSEHKFCQQAGIDKEVLQQIENGGPVAEAKAKRVCDALSAEFERPIRPEDIRGLKIC